LDGLCSFENTFRTQKAGCFADSATWKGGVAPFSEDACVEINHHIHFSEMCADEQCDTVRDGADGDVANLRTGKVRQVVIYRKGTLTLDFQSTILIVTNLLLNEGTINGDGNLIAQQSFVNEGQIGDSSGRLAVVIEKNAVNKGVWCPYITSLETKQTKIVEGSLAANAKFMASSGRLSGFYGGRTLKRAFRVKNTPGFSDFFTTASLPSHGHRSGLSSLSHQPDCMWDSRVIFSDSFTIAKAIKVNGIFNPNNQRVSGSVLMTGPIFGGDSSVFIGSGSQGRTYGHDGAPQNLEVNCGILVFEREGTTLFRFGPSKSITLSAPLVAVGSGTTLVAADSEAGSQLDVKGAWCPHNATIFEGGQATVTFLQELCKVNSTCDSCGSDVISSNVTVTATTTQTLPALTATFTTTELSTVITTLPTPKPVTLTTTDYSTFTPPPPSPVTPTTTTTITSTVNAELVETSYMTSINTVTATKTFITSTVTPPTATTTTLSTVTFSDLTKLKIVYTASSTYTFTGTIQTTATSYSTSTIQLTSITTVSSFIDCDSTLGYDLNNVITSTYTFPNYIQLDVSTSSTSVPTQT